MRRIIFITIISFCTLCFGELYNDRGFFAGSCYKNTVQVTRNAANCDLELFYGSRARLSLRLTSCPGDLKLKTWYKSYFKVTEGNNKHQLLAHLLSLDEADKETSVYIIRNSNGLGKTVPCPF